MIRSTSSKRHTLFTRTALGVALALGVVAGGATMGASPAYAAKKPSMSKGFSQAAVAANEAIEAARKDDAITQAQEAVKTAQEQNNEAAMKAAQARLDSALADEKQLLDAAFAAVENEADRLTAGQLAVGLGGIAMDSGLQRRGLEAMLASGLADPADVPRYQFFVGQLAFVDKDYATAQRMLQAAIDGGYAENNPAPILAEAYLADNKPVQGLEVLKQAIARQEAAGSAAPASWYRRGLAAAYSANKIGLAADFGATLAKAYPEPTNWGGAITIVRELGNFGSQETLDLMRLMGRTNSYAEDRDYVEYIQAADPRRLPGEVVKIVDAGIASGKLNSSDTFVSDARTQASGRVSADKAALPSFERDARASGATEATIMGAADAFLSYGQAAKAEELYQIAADRPGGDLQRAMTRLGIAQVDQGKYAAAQETFAKITGPREPIADLWAAYAEHKAGPATASAPAAPQASAQ